jgi:putative peptide zinc metalloprotease protein
MASESVGVVMVNYEQPTLQPPASAPQTVAIRLCDGLRFVPQRGAHGWQCVVESPKQKRFFRIGRREYLIASALDGKRGLNTLVEQFALTNPELNIDASIVDKTVRWLVASGIAHPVQNIENPNQNTEPPATTQRVAPPIDPFMFRIPLVQGPALERAIKRFVFLGSKPFVALSVAIVCLGVACFAMNSNHFLRLSAQLFVPSAAIWWMGAWLILKAIHEMGHAVVCVAHGGQLRGAGVASFYMAPVPYVDTTDMWRLPDRIARAYCAAGGMWMEIFASSIAILVCQMSENPSIQYFCISIVTLGAFTTIAFNANPLVRFDGYYILSDILNRPNLWTEGQTAMKRMWSDFSKLFNSAAALPSLPLLGYGIACFLNRVVMMVGLAWGAWITYRGVGLVLIALASYLWFVGPYLRRLVQNRKKAALETKAGQPLTTGDSRGTIWRWGGGFIVLTALTLAALLLPSPWQPLSPGFVSLGDAVRLRAQSDGIIAEIYVQQDGIVEEGDPIVRLENPTLSLERERLRKSLDKSLERCLVLRAQAKMAELQVEQARVEATRQQLEQSENQLAQMLITAPKSGRVVSRTLFNSIGKLVKEGQPLADIASIEAIEVLCSIAQADVESYRQNVGEKTEIFLANRRKLSGTLTEVRPRGSDSLENPALAAKYGGPVTVHFTSGSDEKQNPLKTETPRFEARMAMNIEPTDGPLTAGQLCRVGLSHRKMTVAGMLDRWKDSLIQWLKPDEPQPKAT